MTEPLKNVYSKQFIQSLCSDIKSCYPTFDSKSFLKLLFDRDWKNRELKDRMRHIAVCLHKHLPKQYKKALSILKPVSKLYSSYEAMFFPDFVELYGLDHFKESMSALEHFTKYSSSEFAVRPFIVKDPKRMMSQMLIWSNSKNEHVRRLASEGCRPRLPWAMSLPDFKKDPKAVLKVIMAMLQDDSEYVRRSVANNLNDISKDHPKVLIDILKSHVGKSNQTDKLLKHASRTLLKQGEAKAMRLFGLSNPSHISLTDFTVDKKVKLSSKLTFSFKIVSSKKSLGMLRLEYGMYFLKKNGKKNKKVFKISESNVTESIKVVTKKHPFKLISTRVYYPGPHSISIIINGVECEKVLDFIVSPPVSHIS